VQAQDGSGGRRIHRRAFAGGFFVGTGITLPAVALALALTVFEDLLDIFVPAAPLLRGLSVQMASWNGVAAIGLTAVVNGLLYGTVAVAVTAFFRSLRDRRRQHV
jgi:hypothetical protein